MSDSIGFAYMHFENNSRDEFLDGLSPADVHTVLYDLFNFKSPFGFKNDINNETFSHIEVFAWAEKIIDEISENDFILVNSINDWPNTSFQNKELSSNLSKEYLQYGENGFWIFLMEKSGIVRREEEKWVLSKLSLKNLGDKLALLRMLIEAVGFRINWSIFDGKSAYEMGQKAFGISLILLAKYGSDYRTASFYTAKYLEFFEIIKEEPDQLLSSSELDFHSIYVYRTFDCFCNLFNFVEITNDNHENESELSVKSTSIFQSLFQIRQ